MKVLVLFCLCFWNCFYILLCSVTIWLIDLCNLIQLISFEYFFRFSYLFFNFWFISITPHLFKGFVLGICTSYFCFALNLLEQQIIKFLYFIGVWLFLYWSSLDLFCKKSRVLKFCTLIYLIIMSFVILFLRILFNTLIKVFNLNLWIKLRFHLRH